MWPVRYLSLFLTKMDFLREILLEITLKKNHFFK
jgi:hypothetical protein